MTDIYIQRVEPNSTDTGFDVKKEYKLSNVSSFSIDLNSPVSPMPLPEEGADDNMLVKIEGNSATMSLNWVIKNETTTPVTVTESGGASGVLTALQQVGYFTNEPGEGSFQPHSIEDNYRIQLKDGSTVIWEKLGFFTKFTFSMQGNSPVIFNATASFIVGDVITSYEARSQSLQPLWCFRLELLTTVQTFILQVSRLTGHPQQSQTEHLLVP